MADADFWRDLAREFRDIPDDSIFAELTPVGDPEGIPPPIGRWIVYSLSPIFNVRFEALAHRAGDAISEGDIVDALNVWIDAIEPHASEAENDACRLIHSIGLRRITNLPAASAIQCGLMELRELEQKRRNHAMAIPPLDAKAASPLLYAKSDPETPADERKRLLRAYKAECLDHAVKVTDDMIARAASKSWSDRTQVTWWKRNDSRSKPSADRLIRRVLTMKPHIPKP